MTLKIKPSLYGYSIEDLQKIVSTADFLCHRSYPTVVVNDVPTQKEVTLNESRLDTTLTRLCLNERDELHKQYRALFELLATDGPEGPAALIACNDIIRDVIVDLEAERLLAEGKSLLQVNNILSITKDRDEIGPLRFTVNVAIDDYGLIDQFWHRHYCDTTTITVDEVKRLFYPSAWTMAARLYIDRKLGLYALPAFPVENPDFTFEIEVSKWDLARYAILHYKWGSEWHCIQN